MRQALGRLGSSAAEYVMTDIRTRFNTWDQYARIQSTYLEKIGQHLHRGKEEDIQTATQDIHVLNQLSANASKLLDRNTVDVYSMYPVSTGILGGKSYIVGRTEIPRDIKDKIDNNQIDLGNPTEARWLIKTQAKAVFGEPTMYVREIERIGSQLGMRPEVINAIKAEYITNSSKKTKAESQIVIGGGEGEDEKPRLTPNLQGVKQRQHERAVQKGKELAPANYADELASIRIAATTENIEKYRRLRQQYGQDKALQMMSGR
jgi:hypothetical protein